MTCERALRTWVLKSNGFPQRGKDKVFGGVEEPTAPEVTSNVTRARVRQRLMGLPAFTSGTGDW